MSREHKDALAAGRTAGFAVRRYLEALEQHKPRRGRRATPESTARKLADIEFRLSAADPLRRLQLMQERKDLQRRLADAGGDQVDLGALEAKFVEVVREYSARKRISYASWREARVPAPVLRQAGISRAQR